MTGTLRRRLAVLAGRVPRYVTVGDRDPQQGVRVSFQGAGAGVDVTGRHVIVSLRPLTIAIAGAPPGVDAVLQFFSRRPSATAEEPLLGEAWLREEGAGLYRVVRHANHCMSFAPASIYALWHAWESRGHTPDFEMTGSDRLAFEVLYICPRPVVLVSVESAGGGDLFPMDLIGPAGDRFLLARKSTSRSIGLMHQAGRMALADMPLEDAALTIRMGDRDRQVPIDWDGVPFPLDRSPRHGLRVPSSATRVRDVEVRETRTVGSHTVFLTDVVAEQRRRDAPQMFTIAGPYYRYLCRRGLAPERP